MSASVPRNPDSNQLDVAHRGDIRFNSTKTIKGKTACFTTIVDISGTHPVSSSVNSSGEPIATLPLERAPAHHLEPGHHAETRSTDKLKFYNRHYHLQTLEVVPLVLETGGRINKLGRQLISNVARHFTSSGVREQGAAVPYSRARLQLMQRLSVIWQRHNARIFRAYVLGHLRSDLRPGEVGLYA